MRTILFLLAFIALSVAAQDLQVVAVSPTGTTRSIDQSEMITVTFSLPMVDLQSVGGASNISWFTITPVVPGTFRWQGTSTVSFIPSVRLKYGTAYTVSLPAGLRSVSGKVLKEGMEWRFITPVLSVAGTEPWHGQEMVETDHAMMVRFDQRVDPNAVAKFISVRVTKNNNTEYPAFRLQWTGKGDTDRVYLQTVKPMPNGARVDLTVRAGVRGIEGELGMNNDATVSFSTVPYFAFLGLRNTDVRPGQALVFQFSTPVTMQDILDHLRIQPEVKIGDRDRTYSYASKEWYLEVETKPGTEYTVTILPGLKDQYEQILREPVTAKCTTTDYEPYISMPTGFGLLESYEQRRIPISLINMSSFRLRMGRVDENAVIRMRHDLTHYGDLFDRLSSGITIPAASAQRFANVFTFDRTIAPKVKKNTVGYYYAMLDSLLKNGHTGTVLVRTEDSAQYYQTMVNVTNIGVTAKFSPDNILIWATSLKSAAALPNAVVEIRSDDNAVLWKGKTGPDGIAAAPGWSALGINTGRTAEEYDPDDDNIRVERPTLWVFVRSGNDLSYISSNDDTGIDPWSFDINYEWNPSVEKIRASLFTDRGLYKAGERVDLKGIVRSLKGGRWNVVAGDSVRIIMKNTKDEEILSMKAALSAYGSVTASVTLPANAPLGYYYTTMELREKNGKGWRWMNIASTSARVEAFRPAEFDVTALFGKKSYIAGDSISGVVSARYLFGAPLKNAPVRWRLSVTGGEYTPPGWENFYISDIPWLSAYDGSHFRELNSIQDELDENGNIIIRSNVNVGEVTRTSMLMLEADATSPSRQVISGRTSVVLHQGEFYPAIGQSSSFITADSAVTFRVAAVSPEGTAMPGIPLTMKVYQRIWRSVRRAEVGGRYHWESKVDNIVMDSSEVMSGNDPVSLRYIPREAGFYYTELSGTDARGNHVMTNSTFYVTGSGYVAWERSNDDRIELVADKKNYAPGERARIMVKNPYERATALVSVEREGIISHFITTVNGSAPQIEIPLTDECLPNVFVSVVLLQGRVDSIAATRDADIGRPSFKIGYVELPVSPLQKRLTVTVSTPKKDYRPGDTVAVTVKTALSNGKPVRAEATLSVADLGVLNLIGYRIPDLFPRYYEKRGLSVLTAESRAHLIEQRNFGEKAEAIGGGGAEKMMAQVDADGVRKDFRPSAYWNPSIITDTSGTATVRFKLPDNITAFELMASAHTKSSEFGYGENAITVSKPLLLQPSFPRFVRSGDEFEGGVVVLNYSEKTQNIRITASVEGVQRISPDTARITLAPGASKEFRLKLKAGKTGTAKFIFRAMTDDDRDGLQWTIPVQVPRLKETVATSGTVTDAPAAERITKPAETFEELGSVEMNVTSTQLIGLQNSVRYLFEYPYGCLEQKMSRALPIILGAEMVRSFGLEMLNGRDEKQAVQDVLDEASRYQQANGGFTLWKNQYDANPSPYLSAYAMYGLTMAKIKGYRVDASMMDLGNQYLRKVLSGDIEQRSSAGVVSGTQAFILYVLALQGKPDHGYMERLYNVRGTLPLFGRAYLLRALKASNGNASMINTLATEMMSAAKFSQTTVHFEERTENDWWCMFPSSVKSTALIAQALIETQPKNEIIPKAVRWLLEQQHNGIWRSTQENLAVVDALSSYFAAYEKETPDFTASVKLGTEEVLRELFSGRSMKRASVSRSLDKLASGSVPVDVTREGKGRLYYTLRLNYYPMARSMAKDEGFSVTKTVEQLTTDPSGIATIPVGTLAKVTVIVSTKQDRPYVVIDDPIPAGFEIVNTSFKTTAAAMGEGEESQERYDPIDHRELRDDRALFFSTYLPAGIHTMTYFVRATSFGTFAMPSTRVEQMYEPEVFGQTNSETVRVQ